MAISQCLFSRRYLCAPWLQVCLALVKQTFGMKYPQEGTILGIHPRSSRDNIVTAACDTASIDLACCLCGNLSKLSHWRFAIKTVVSFCFPPPSRSVRSHFISISYTDYVFYPGHLTKSLLEPQDCGLNCSPIVARY